MQLHLASAAHTRACCQRALLCRNACTPSCCLTALPAHARRAFWLLAWPGSPTTASLARCSAVESVPVLLLSAKVGLAGVCPMFACTRCNPSLRCCWEPPSPATAATGERVCGVCSN